MTIGEKIQNETNLFASRLIDRIGQNLYSLILYGSAVRGDMVEKASDINLLIVLEESTPSAHQTIAEVVDKHRRVDPFIIGRRGMERSIRAFATKFLSIQRDYRILHGVDWLAELTVDPDHERFLVEQALRNLRLRLIHAYVTMRHNRAQYTKYVLHLRTAAVIQISEAMRLNGVEMPHDFEDRFPIIENEAKLDTSVLRNVTAIKKQNRLLRRNEIEPIHTRMFTLLDHMIHWIEQLWPSQ